MVYIGLINFYKHFVSHYMDLGLRGAKLYRTSTNEFYVGVNNKNFDIKDLDDVPDIFSEELEVEVISEQNFNKPHIRKWQFEKQSTNDANVFLIAIENNPDFVKKLVDVLNLDQLSKLSRIESPESSLNFYILNDFSISDFKIITNQITEGENVECFYYHEEHSTYYPLYLSMIKQDDDNRSCVVYFTDDKTEDISEFQEHTFEQLDIKLNGLKSFQHDEKLEVEHLLSKKTEPEQDNVISTFIEIDKTDLKEAASEVVSRLNQDDSVVFFELEDKAYAFVKDVKLHSEFITEFVDEHNSIFKQVNTSLFPKDLSEELEINDDEYFIAKRIGEHDHFQRFKLVRVGKDNTKQVSEIIDHKRDFKINTFEPIKSFEKDSSIVEFVENVLHQYQDVEEEVVEQESFAKAEPILAEPSVEVAEVETDTPRFVYDNEILGEIRKDEPREEESEVYNVSTKLISYYLESKRDIDISQVWRDLYHELQENKEYSETELIRVLHAITNILWYSDSTNKQEIKRMLDEIQPKVKNSSSFKTIDAISYLTSQNYRKAESINKIRNLEQLNYKLRVLILDVIFKNKLSKIYLQRKIEGLISSLNLDHNNLFNNYTFLSFRENFRQADDDKTNEVYDLTEVSGKLSGYLKDLLKISEDNSFLPITYIQLLYFALRNNNTEIRETFYSALKKKLQLKDKLQILNEIIETKSNKNLQNLLRILNDSFKENYLSEIDDQILEITLNEFSKDNAKKLNTILSSSSNGMIFVLSKLSQKWINILGLEEYTILCEQELYKIADAEKMFITDNELRAIVSILESMKEKDDGNYFAENLLVNIWDSIRVKDTQYEILLDSCKLDLSNLLIKKIFENDVVLFHFLAWKDTANTSFYYRQVLYARHLCNVGKINQAIDLLIKIYDRIEYLTLHRMINTSGMPVHTVFAELVNTLPLTGKLRESNTIIQNIKSLIKTNNLYFGRSTYSVERIEIYSALIYYYSAIEMPNTAEGRIINLMETILPMYRQGHPEHILFIFKSFWKVVIKHFPSILIKLIGIFDRIFEDVHSTSEFKNEYKQIFSIYKEFAYYISDRRNELPEIELDDETDFSGDSSNRLLFKTWLEVSEDVKVFRKVSINDFIDTTYNQILETNSGLDGFNELVVFLTKNYDTNIQKDSLEEKLVKLEIRELKERITNIYNKLV